MLSKEEIRKVSVVDLAYIAGIIDGEGCISISHYANTYALQLSVKMADVGAVSFIQEKIGGNRYHVKRVPPVRNQEKWVLCGSDAAFLLQFILPYLRVKRAQALLAIEYRASKISKEQRPFYQKNMMKLNVKIFQG